MEWLLIALAAAGACGYATRHGLRARERHLTLRDQVTGVSRLLSEDLSWVGDELGRLDREVFGVVLDNTSREDHNAAHASYASAERALPGVRTAAAVGEVADALADAAHRVASIRARLAAEAVPDRWRPCFFDVRHGAATNDVVWTDPVHGSRSVPACAQDAALIAEGRSPNLRKARVGARTLAYWNAGAPSEAYYRGWFASEVPFLPAPRRSRQGVDSRAVERGEAEALRYGTPTGPTGPGGSGFGTNGGS